jgi:uncharacterized protein YndB with AHSA1/START domain
MDWTRYRFCSAWRLAAPPDVVYQVLERPEEYPQWWPQVREARRTGETTGTLRLRSVLPYDVHVTVRQTRRDPVARVLEVAMPGDLEGWVRWTILPTGDGTELLFEEDATVNKPLMRRLAVPGRPVFRANHTCMMRRARRGLLDRLAAEAGRNAV